MSFLCFINFFMFCNCRTDTLQAFTIIVLTSVGRLLTRRWSGGVFSHIPFWDWQFADKPARCQSFIFSSSESIQPWVCSVHPLLLNQFWDEYCDFSRDVRCLLCACVRLSMHM